MQGFDDIDDDGATEVVGRRARRKIERPAEIADIAKAPAGGRISSSHDRTRPRDAVVVRKAGQPAMRITLSHMPIFKAIWATWSARRVRGLDDPGVAVRDIVAHLEASGHGDLQNLVKGAVRSLVRASAIRTTDQHVGGAGRRTLYYPTEAGVQAFALAETLGASASVQVGGTVAGWANRAADAPLTLFEYASLIKGGGALPETT